MDSHILMKREIVATTNTHGWKFITQLAEEAVAAREREALDEEDEAKVVSSQRQAKAARAFLNTFLELVEAHRRVDVEAAQDDALVTY